MKKRHQIALGCLVTSLIFLEFAYLTLIPDRPMTFVNEHGQPLSSPALTAWFRAAAWGSLAAGSLLLMHAIRSYFRGESSMHGGTKESRLKQLLLKSGRFWLVFNIALVAVSVWTGYAETSPGPAPGGHSDVQLIFYAAIIVLIPLFVVCTVHFSFTPDLRQPSWFRFPFNWTGDPLQALHVSTWCTLGLTAGSLFKTFDSDPLAHWSSATYGCIFVGLLVGRKIVSLVYRDRIIEKESEGE